MEMGIICGGWCPQGRKAEDGTIPDKYPLQETDSTDHSRRTLLNVKESEGSLVLHAGIMDMGTQKTLEYLKKERKKFLLLNLLTRTNPLHIRDWITNNNIALLNVAGPRESNSPGIYSKSRSFLQSVFSL